MLIFMQFYMVACLALCVLKSELISLYISIGKFGYDKYLYSRDFFVNFSHLLFL
jgi:hypothetical protein